jgi:hypothetical protein
MPYAAAFSAAVTSASWQPGTNLVVKGYQGAITQLAVGIGVNWLAEFGPDIKQILRIGKRKATAAMRRDVMNSASFSVRQQLIKEAESYSVLQLPINGAVSMGLS